MTKTQLIKNTQRTNLMFSPALSVGRTLGTATTSTFMSQPSLTEWLYIF